MGSDGLYGGATSAVLLGFLNFFLWSCNLWYLYKETAWFRGAPVTNAAREAVVASEVTEADQEDV